MRPVDSHCHLHFEQFDEDRDEVIGDIEQCLEFAVLAGCSYEDNRDARNIAERSDSLNYCMGLHPLYHDESNAGEVREQIGNSSASAVGEIGLDYNYITDKDEREETIKLFKEMLEIAEKENLNAVIHSRNAEDKCFEIVQSYDVKGFFHCFNGRPELATKIAEEDHKVGVTTQVVDSNRVRNIVKKVPMESMLLETDSPYLGLNGRNTPLKVGKVAEEIADIKSIDLGRVKKISTRSSEGFLR